ncbi:MAG: 12-oxophytodienoate reductase [Pseudonocardiales bacterium]|nr:12-oxophytodienoate reductase [Pseudonocardiales bacterium]
MPREPVVDASAMFEPMSLRGLTLPNRFVMPAMQRSWCSDGGPTDFLTDYYCRRVEGGVGLIITEACAVDHPSATQSAKYGWISPRTAAAWRRCLGRVRDAGGHVFVQLWHEGAVRVGGESPTAAPSLSPSGIVGGGRTNGRAATEPELREIAAAFARSAAIARESGASGVELHACHGYLLDQFLWAETNRRQDDYGGTTVLRRATFVVALIEGVRRAVGDDFPISLRLSQWKEVDYGARIARDPAELHALLGLFRSAGVDLFHASTRRFWQPEWPELDPDLGLAGWMKRATDAAVIAVGSVGLDIDVMSNVSGSTARSSGVHGYREMVRRFERGDFDLMSIGRGQIGDPNWVNTLRSGRLPAVRAFSKADLLQDRELPTLVQ